MSTAPDLKFQWPSNESEARQALNHAKWLSDVMSGDTMVMDELLVCLRSLDSLDAMLTLVPRIGDGQFHDRGNERMESSERDDLRFAIQSRWFRSMGRSQSNGRQRIYFAPPKKRGIQNGNRETNLPGAPMTKKRQRVFRYFRQSHNQLMSQTSARSNN
jgi:hypothetical protein